MLHFALTTTLLPIILLLHWFPTVDCFIIVRGSFGSTHTFRRAQYAVRNRPGRLDEWETKGGKSSKANANKNLKRKKFDNGKKRGNKAVMNDKNEVDAVKTVIASAEFADKDPYKSKEPLIGLVIERLGDRLLVQPEPYANNGGNKNTIKPILCSQRASLCDDALVVGDRVDYYDLAMDDAKRGSVIDICSTDNANVCYCANSLSTSSLEKEGKENKKHAVKKRSMSGVVVRLHTRRNMLQRPSGTCDINAIQIILEYAR